MTIHESACPHHTKVSKFWDGLRDGILYGTKCKKCGNLTFPPKADCEKCKSSDIDWIQLSGDGELLTYTINKVPPPTFADFPEYIIAIVKLKEGPRLMTWLTDINAEEVKIGMKLKAEPKETPDGRLTYEFKPVKN